MKNFEVEMNIQFTKTVRIEAPDEAAATVLAETMLLCTDALPLTDEDMVALATTATELGTSRQADDAEEEDDEFEDDDAFSDSSLCCGVKCGRCCHLCDEDDDDEYEDEDEDEEYDEDDESDPDLRTITGKPMGLDEMMLHLSLYLEDAEDSLDDIQSIFSSIETFDRAILKAKSAQETPAKMPPLKLQ